MWTVDDGREVLFDRKYRPRWVRRPGEKATVAEPQWWVPWIRQRWFFDDRCAPWLSREPRLKRERVAAMERCEAVLAAFLRGQEVPAWTFERGQGTWIGAPDAHGAGVGVPQL